MSYAGVLHFGRTYLLSLRKSIKKGYTDKLLEKPIQRPTLFIWGVQDPVIAPAIIPLQKQYIKASYQELALATGHSLIQTKTDSVIHAILTHMEN